MYLPKDLRKGDGIIWSLNKTGGIANNKEEEEHIKQEEQYTSIKTILLHVLLLYSCETFYLTLKQEQRLKLSKSLSYGN